MASKACRSSSSVRSSGSCRSVIQCTICSKTFNNSSALAKHKLIHSEERRYVCSQCSKSFKRQDHLNGHIMTHASKKPYECKYVGCDKSYCDARSLKRHLENQHQQPIDSCSSAASDGTLTPRSATDLPSAGQPAVFNFDFMNSPGVASQNTATDHGLAAGLSHSQSSPTVSAGCNAANLPSSGMIWIGGINPLEEPLPVQCNFCDRRFRNLAALNGHMRLHGGYIQKKDEVDEAKSQVSADIQVSVSDSSSPKPLSVDILPCSTANCVLPNSLVCSISSPVLSKDSMPAHRAGVQDGVTGDDSLEPENDWFSYKSVTNDDLGIVHDGLDMVGMEDCTSAFAGESVCNTIDFDTIIDLGLNTTDVVTALRSRDYLPGSFVDQPEIVSDQSQFANSINQLADSVTGDAVLHYVDDTEDKDAVGLGIQLVCPDADSVKTPAADHESMSADVPSCVASSLSSVKCELATSFLTPKTPTHSHGLPTYATHFSFSSPDVLPSSPVSVPRPKTPVVSISLPVRAHRQSSPHAPYTPDTPSVFQFPSPNQSPASSSGCSPASRHSKRHAANYHPYSSASATVSSPRYSTQQPAPAQQLEQQRRLELEVAEAEIDQYIHQLQQADLQRTQQSQMRDTCPKEMSSKLSITLPPETDILSRTSSSNSMCGQAVSPIEEVIQILVAEHFGVTVPSKFIQGDLKRTGTDPKVRMESASQPATADNTDEHLVTDEFRNPGTVPASKPRKRKPEPLVIPASVSNFGFRSQLRSPKLAESLSVAQQCHTTSTPPYTPPPMISPARTGSGVFWTLHGARQMPAGPLSAPPCRTSFLSLLDADRVGCESNLPPLTDVEPHVNIGPQYQADLASVAGERYVDAEDSGTLVWDPKVVENLTDAELKSYQNFACSANIPGSRANHEYALHLLQACNGHIKAAQKKLLQKDRCSSLSQHDEWSQQEMETFSRCLIETNKDFAVVAKQVGTKSVKQCVEFYYIWKKVCEDEYKLLCQARKQRLNSQLDALCSSVDTSGMKNQDGRSDVV